MSLATRCFTCGTVFRVVQDQLKVSEGWVRCGQCNEIFNALETLFDLERDVPPEWSPPIDDPDSMPSRLGMPVDLELPVDMPPAHTQTHVDEDSADHIDVPLVAPRREASSTPAERIAERDRLDFPDAQFDPESGESIAASEPAEPAASVDGLDPAEAEPRLAMHDISSGSTLDADAEAPEFVLHAQRQARWSRPGARIALSLTGLCLLSALALQVGNHFRDTLAARWPDTKPLLTAWCGVADCALQPPKHIEEIAVDSSSLTRAEDVDAFRLSVTLRNHGTLALALPAVDLSLTDASGQLVARRVIAPKEWHSTAGTLSAGAELPLQLLLAADNARVTGYTVEVFYP